MIIDFHTHIFPDAIAERAVNSLADNIDHLYEPVTNGTAGALLSRMDEWGVDKSVILPVVTKESQVKSTNEWAAQTSSDRIIAFGGIFPHAENYKEAIDFVASLGFKGIKLHPEYQNFVLDDARMLRVYDYAISRGLMLIFHAGFDPAMQPPFKSNPAMFAHVLDELKGGTIIAAHLGGQSQWDDVERYLVGRDIYLDTAMGFSYYPKDQFMRIVRNHGAQKILFGTDSPWSNAGEEIAALKALELGEDEKEMILGKNAVRLLINNTDRGIKDNEKCIHRT